MLALALLDLCLACSGEGQLDHVWLVEMRYRYLRLIKRVLYTGIGAGIGASVCYPEEANEAMATVEKEGKKAVETVQALANGGEEEASADLCLVCN